MRDVLTRLYRAKLLLSCVLFVGIGIVLMSIGNVVGADADAGWLRFLPWSEFGGILIGAGVLSIWLDHFLAREQRELDDARLRHLLREQAPAMRDAVLDAFAANHADLERVATPELLDGIITNSLALRLGDEQFAREVYADILMNVVQPRPRT